MDNMILCSYSLSRYLYISTQYRIALWKVQILINFALWKVQN